MSLRFLVADCETAKARDQRRRSAGASAGEAYAAVLREMQPSAATLIVNPADDEALTARPADVMGYDAVFLTGSPIHVYDDSAAARRELAFMRAVYASGTPSFGSCAGLQVAVAAAGGSVRPMARRRESGFARNIWLTEEGARHPLPRGRPRAYTAVTVHGDEVERLPDGATLLAGNAASAVQAVEIRHGVGVFWGVQYHPELSLADLATATRRDADTLIEQGLARDADDVEAQASLIDALAREPDRADLHWRLGVDEQVTRTHLRRRELRNFIDALVVPTARLRR